MVHRFQLLGALKAHSRQRGFTMIEMAIVLVLSSVILIAFYGFVAAHTMSSYEDCSEINVQSDIRKTMAGVVQELEGAHLVALDPWGSYVQYQVPLTGPSGTLQLDPNGNTQWGVWPPGLSHTTPANFVKASSGLCYYTLIFRDSSEPNDKLVENTLTSQYNSSGQNISGTFGTGSANLTVGYDKCFVYGHFEVECWTTVGGAIVKNASVRALPGRCLRQYDPTVAVPNAPPSPTTGLPIDLTAGSPPYQRYGVTHNYGGGFFYLRNPGQTQLGSCQMQMRAGQPVYGYSAGESFLSLNSPGVDEDPDCEPFTNAISSISNVYDGTGSFTEVNGNGVWNAKLRIQIRSFDLLKTAPNISKQRELNGAIRLLTVRVKILG